MKKQKITLITIVIILFLVYNPVSSQASLPWDIMVYDDGDPDFYLSLSKNDSVAVNFAPPADTFKLSGIIIYSSTSNLTKIRVWVLNASMDVIMAPLYPSIGLGTLPPYDINFGEFAPIFTSENISNFYIVVQWITLDIPNFGIGVDNSTFSGESFINQSGVWAQYTHGNIMIRARIEDIRPPTFDHIPLLYAAEGKPVSISVNVSDEFQVESVTLAYREKGSNGTSGTISLQLASGTLKTGIWYGLIPGENVTAAGLEYWMWATDSGFNQQYYGNASYPFSVTVIQFFEMPLTTSIIIIIAIFAAAMVLYIYLPKYQGEEPN